MNLFRLVPLFFLATFSIVTFANETTDLRAEVICSNKSAISAAKEINAKIAEFNDGLLSVSAPSTSNAITVGHTSGGHISDARAIESTCVTVIYKAKKILAEKN